MPDFNFGSGAAQGVPTELTLGGMPVLPALAVGLFCAAVFRPRDNIVIIERELVVPGEETP